MSRKTGPEDILFRVLYCGIDHTDLHLMRSEIHTTNYPLVPGYIISQPLFVHSLNHSYILLANKYTILGLEISLLHNIRLLIFHFACFYIL